MLRHFSHRCRNSLSGIKLGLYLLNKEMQAVACPLERPGAQVRRDREAFRPASANLSIKLIDIGSLAAGAVIAERMPLWRSRYPEWGRTILLDPPEPESPAISIPRIWVSGSTRSSPGGPSRADSRQPCSGVAGHRSGNSRSPGRKALPTRAQAVMAPLAIRSRRAAR